MKCSTKNNARKLSSKYGVMPLALIALDTSSTTDPRGKKYTFRNTGNLGCRLTDNRTQLGVCHPTYNLLHPDTKSILENRFFHALVPDMRWQIDPKHCHPLNIPPPPRDGSNADPGQSRFRAKGFQGSALSQRHNTNNTIFIIILGPFPPCALPSFLSPTLFPLFRSTPKPWPSSQPPTVRGTQMLPLPAMQASQVLAFFCPL